MPSGASPLNLVGEILVVAKHFVGTSFLSDCFIRSRSHRANDACAGKACQLNCTATYRASSTLHQDGTSLYIAGDMDGPVRSDPGNPEACACSIETFSGKG